jgi:bla regulator protein blaR1
MIRELENHLWQSTLFACVAALLTLMLRRNRAAVRHWLWLAASVKFLVPFSILVGIGSQVEWRKAPVVPQPRLAVVEQISEPFALPASSPPVAPTPRRPNRLLAVVFGVWLCGFAAYSLAWYRCWRRMRAALRAATALPLKLPIGVMSSPVPLEPGLFGIRRPVLLLPEGITEHLTPAQFEAVVAHELCHVRRRDNLAAGIHMVVEALFWFHPLVWWIGRRLVEERERACDEAVLRMATDPQDYAEGIVKVCRFCMESPLVCVPGVTGGNLRQRVEEIMLNREGSRLNFGRKLLLAVAGVIAVAGPLAVGIVDSPKARAQSQAQLDWQRAAGGKMSFEVASIRPTSSFTPPDFPLSADNSYRPTGGLFRASFPLATYIEFAYKLSLSPDQRKSLLSGLPKWVATDRFAIEAKAANNNPTKDQMRLMVQSLLGERFRLAVHFEGQQVPAFALTLIKPGKPGPRLHPHSEGAPCDVPATANGNASSFGEYIRSAEAPHVFPAICDVLSTVPPGVTNPGVAKSDAHMALAGSRNTSMDLIADELISQIVDRPVVDRTGLTGRFDFTMEWMPEPGELFALPGAGPQSDFQGTTFLEALREQLGLKLESTKATIQVLVIDHLERPSEN